MNTAKPTITLQKSGYVPPHLKAKLPPKELTSDDIKNEALFPVLSSSSPSQKTPTIDFSQLLKDEPILPLVSPKEREALAWHPLTKVVVYDMSDEELIKKKGDSWMTSIEIPQIVKKATSFLSLIEDYLKDDENTDNMSCVSDV
jgi:hypothetical protein